MDYDNGWGLKRAMEKTWSLDGECTPRAAASACRASHDLSVCASGAQLLDFIHPYARTMSLISCSMLIVSH